MPDDSGMCLTVFAKITGMTDMNKMKLHNDFKTDFSMTETSVIRNKFKKSAAAIAAAVLVVICTFGFSGCTGQSDDFTKEEYSSVVSEEYASAASEKDTSPAAEDIEEAQNEDSSQAELLSSFTLSDIPEYSGDAYAAINNNIPFFEKSDYTTEAFENYSPLDSLGRCGTAYANICLELMPSEERGSIGSVKPSGWHTVRYDGMVDGKYLYNRCHLIGYQLSGENANEKNLITGTRYMNVDGMLPFENMVADYVHETGNHVLYRVNPIFDGNNLVASGVLMEAKSVEDDGDGIEFCVYCYNVQPGITINYATGDSEKSDSSATDESKKNDSSAVAAAEESHEEIYIGNKNSKVFHLSECSSVKKMSEKNKISFDSRDDAVDAGYHACKSCNP